MRKRNNNSTLLLLLIAAVFCVRRLQNEEIPGGAGAA